MKNYKKGLVISLIITTIVLLCIGMFTYFYINNKSIKKLNKSLEEVSKKQIVTEIIVSTSTKESTPLDWQKFLEEYYGYPIDGSLNDTFAKSKPVDREIPTIDTSSYKTSKLFKYQFKTSWGEGNISSETRFNEDFQEIEYKNGKKISFYCKEKTIKDHIEDVYGCGDLPMFGNIEERNKIINYLKNKVDSGYSYMNYILSTTPSDIQEAITNKKEDIENIYIILLLKSFTFCPTPDQPYRFKVNNIKGFQFGDNKSDYFNAIIFPSENEMCEINQLSTDKISQADMDIIYSTFETSK